MKILESLSTVFWGVALCLGIVLALSLLLGILSQSRYEQQRKKWLREIGGRE